MRIAVSLTVEFAPWYATNPCVARMRDQYSDTFAPESATPTVALNEELMMVTAPAPIVEIARLWPLRGTRRFTVLLRSVAPAFILMPSMAALLTSSTMTSVAVPDSAMPIDPRPLLMYTRNLSIDELGSPSVSSVDGMPALAVRPVWSDAVPTMSTGLPRLSATGASLNSPVPTSIVSLPLPLAAAA